MPTTQENLASAFAGESQANRKYLAFAKKAEHEGYPQIARVFRAAADAETIHALGHLNNLNGVGSTLENLKEAVKGETWEFTQMYPPMLAQAEQEGHKSKVMFGFAAKAERVHAGLFEQALAASSQARTCRRWTSTCARSAATSSSGRYPISAPSAERRRRSTSRSRSGRVAQRPCFVTSVVRGIESRATDEGVTDSPRCHV